MEQQLAGFIDFFRTIPDHRIERKKLYPIEELLLVAFCGVIAGCDGWDDLELFGETKLEDLRRYLPFKHGAPSDDTLRRFFRALDPARFEACFQEWVQSFQLDLTQQVIAIDGKTSRRSVEGEGRAFHMISAFASEAGLVLGQRKVDGKSNEITAIPQLLDVLDIRGATITLDAMGCQTKVVDKIIEREAAYVIGLKGNQESLNEDVRLLFEEKPATLSFAVSEESDKGHGRVEIRKCTMTEDIQWLQERHPRWKHLRSVIEVESTRDIKGQVTVEKRYYISSLAAHPDAALNAVRQHWGIENKLHWVLDICFGDDQSRIRKGNAPTNIAILKKTALNLLRLMKKDYPRISFKKMRKLAGWDYNFMDAVLRAKF
jgi:predicted transposase YbfD/YdcC